MQLTMATIYSTKPPGAPAMFLKHIRFQRRKAKTELVLDFSGFGIWDGCGVFFISDLFEIFQEIDIPPLRGSLFTIQLIPNETMPSRM